MEWQGNDSSLCTALAVDPSKPFKLTVDASLLVIGAILVQRNENSGQQSFAYLSRQLTNEESSYTALEREVLAVIWSLDALRPSLMGRKIHLYLDRRTMLQLLTQQTPSTLLIRLAVELQSYDYE